ncbi:unnamed protein product [Tilletia controversa]|nr:unnamed protein product [Tilletia controversa]
MTSKERALLQLVTRHPEQNRRCFDIACSYLFGDLSLLQAGEQLDALSLGLLRRKNFGTFVSALGEAKSTDGLTPTSDCWAIVPASAMQEGNKLWAAFQTDPIVDDQRQLLKGYKSGASESGLGKRRRRAPGDLSDYVTDGEGRSTGTPEVGKTYITFVAAQQHLFARGHIHINTSNPLSAPIIVPHYFENDFDIEVSVAGTEYLRKIANAPNYASYIATEVIPGAQADMAQFVRDTAATEYHGIGTCSMLPRNQGGVVDNKLVVYGTSNVRVADASIIPLHVATHLQGTVYGIGEFAADIIKDWSYKQFLLSLTVLRGPHTGAALAGHLIRVLSQHGLLDLWSGILVGDAGSANTRTCDALEYEVSQANSDLQAVVEYRRGDHSIFCFNHVFNRGMVDFYQGMGLKADENDTILCASADNPDEVKAPAASAAAADDSDNESRSDVDGVLEDEVDVVGHGDGIQLAPTGHAIGVGEGEDGGPEKGGVLAGEGVADDPEAEQALKLFEDMRCKLPTVAEEDETDDNDGAGDQGKDQGDGGGLVKDDDDEDLANPLNKIARLVVQIYNSSEALREFQRWMEMAYRDGPNPKLALIVTQKLNQTRWNSRFK